MYDQRVDLLTPFYHSDEQVVSDRRYLHQGRRRCHTKFCVMVHGKKAQKLGLDWV